MPIYIFSVGVGCGLAQIRYINQYISWCWNDVGLPQPQARVYNYYITNVTATTIPSHILNSMSFINTCWTLSYGTNNCWFPLARKWPTWKWTWIWIPYGKIGKNVRATSDGIHAEIHEIWTCVAPAAPPPCHAAVNPCLQSEFSWRESPWNWSCNSANLRKSTVTWMSRHYVFTVIFRWSTFSSTVNLCNINCVIFSDTHCSHSPFHAGV